MHASASLFPCTVIRQMFAPASATRITCSYKKCPSLVSAVTISYGCQIVLHLFNSLLDVASITGGHCLKCDWVLAAHWYRANPHRTSRAAHSTRIALAVLSYSTIGNITLATCPSLQACALREAPRSRPASHCPLACAMQLYKKPTWSRAKYLVVEVQVVPGFRRQGTP